MKITVRNRDGIDTIHVFEGPVEDRSSGSEEYRFEGRSTTLIVRQSEVQSIIVEKSPEEVAEEEQRDRDAALRRRVAKLEETVGRMADESSKDKLVRNFSVVQGRRRFGRRTADRIVLS